MAIFGRKRALPPRVATDEVVPLHFMDHALPFRDLIIGWTGRLDDVLDAARLHDALERLFARDGWRKLGGRLRIDDKGAFVLHIPQTFGSDRPAVRFSHDSYDIGIDQHPLASQLPRATDRPCLQPASGVFYPLAAAKDAPVKLDDWLYSDIPAFSLHVVSFTDATLVSLLWQHKMADCEGLRTIVVNWSHVLAGRDDLVQPFVGGGQDDPLLGAVGISKGPDGKWQRPEQAVRWVKEDRVLRGYRFFVFVFWLLWDAFLGARMHSRTVFLPAATFKAMKARAIRDLTEHQEQRRSTDDASTASRTPFISDGDVLAAWTSKMAVSHLGPSSARPVLVMNVFDVRKRLSSFDPAAAYVQNLVLPCSVLLDVGSILDLPLGALALRFRTAIVEQVEPEVQVREYLRRNHKATTEGGPGLMVGEPTMFMATVTNWAKMKLFESADFSPAVVKAGARPPGSLAKPGRVVYQHGLIPWPSWVARNTINITGQDPAGNFWLQAYLRQASWELIEKELRRL